MVFRLLFCVLKVIRIIEIRFRHDFSAEGFHDRWVARNGCRHRCIEYFVPHHVLIFGLFWIRAITNSSNRFVLAFLLTGGVSSLIFGLLFYDDGENLAYLIQTAIALILPISIIAACNSNSDNKSKVFNEIAIAVVIGLLAAKFSWSVFNRVSGSSVQVVYRSSLAVLMPLVVGLFLFAIARALTNYELRRASIFVVVSLIASATFGSYVSFASNFLSRWR